jgi:hypothetical protein
MDQGRNPSMGFRPNADFKEIICERRWLCR